MTDRSSPDWCGRWVSEALGVVLEQRPDDAGPDIGALAGLALRDNPRRAHLVVSTVLGKHVPTAPDVVHAAARLLGVLVSAELTDDRPAGIPSGALGTADLMDLLAQAMAGSRTAAPSLIAACEQRRTAPSDGVVVLGYAETATALGHVVADSIGAYYLHSTRRQVDGVPAAGWFAEEHSHATAHALLAERADRLLDAGQIVLVDDELTTGRTALNTISELERLRPGRTYVIAALLDLRSDADLSTFTDYRAETGTRIRVVSLARGTVTSGSDLLQRAAVMMRHHPAAEPETGPRHGELIVVPTTGWPADLPEGGRHGIEPTAAPALARATADVARAVATGLVSGRVLVLGAEELMYAPLQIARSLSRLTDADTTVLFSSTTRSPVHALDQPGYAIRHALSFCAHDDPVDGPGMRYAYNIEPDEVDEIVLIIDAAGDTAQLRQPGGLLEQLRGRCARLHLVVLPCYRPAGPARSALPRPLTGPQFGSYPAEDVRWLLSDLSGSDLEAETEEREEAIARGTAHYAQSLPIEYQPSPQYQELFDAALTRSAATVATAIGIVTEIVLAERGTDVVLGSLARAGVPIAILMRHWARFAHQLDLPHYALSIVRARGIDTLALRYLAENHEPSTVVFVDGWTGKGAITAELESAVRQANADFGWRFDPDLAVLADTGRCSRTFGTRADFLIPSACLNSTVSGLVSRTVLNDALIGPNMFHGAKFYSGLAPADVSMRFIDAVRSQFPAVAPAVSRQWPEVADSDRTPDWAGWQAVQKISADYGIGDVNLVKPGVGETTRVLLRRVPWKVLMRRDAAESLPHVRLLAEQRGVEVELVDELAYRCVGLILPGFTRTPTVVAVPNS